MNFGATEIIIIVLIILVLFGGKRLPGLAKSLGSSIRSFRKGIDESKKQDADSNDNMTE